MKISKRNALLGLFDIGCYFFVLFTYWILSFLTSSGISICSFSCFATDGAILFGCIFFSRILLRAYNNVWRYTSTVAYVRLLISDAVGALAAVLISRIVGINAGFWFFITIASLNTLAALFARYCYRLLYKWRNNKNSNNVNLKNICIIGAGQIGAYLANELKNSPNSSYNPVCFIDIDPSKIGSKVVGLEVFSCDNIIPLIDRYDIDELVIAMSSANSQDLDEIRSYYSKFGRRVKLYDSPTITKEKGTKSNRVIRDFSIEDLLFRDQLKISDTVTTDYYKNKVVLITGGGGSIGSELCRQVARCSPKKLIIFDIYENNVYDIQLELQKEYGKSLDLHVEIGSVRDVGRLEYIFNVYRPQIVFHAAAHKHVPLMEQSCAEAVKNNVLGTYNTANAAEKYGVEKFILISTDKAVNPTNIMGASKRLCEMVVQCRTDGNTSFSAVRFGNVLGSNGSVIPLFKRQIQSGGPVTITDKRIIRYFMTIPEASQLVMTAGAMAKRGELFVLDMGKPVKIYDLAVNMIKLSGFVPERDIKITEIGLRPGEKLYEELLMQTEQLGSTSHKLIFTEHDKPYEREYIDGVIEKLRSAVIAYEKDYDINAIRNVIKENVSTFKEPEEVNKDAENSEEMKQTCNV